jgi:pentose-5-phosphate-3-epimerase
MKISASIYSTDRPLQEVVKELDAHRIDYFHVDCNDDVRVFEDIKKIREWSTTPVDLHIISSTPEKYFDLLRETPVDYVTFQHEDLKGKLVLPADIKGRKGLAITANSDISVFDDYANDFDFMLMMATIPGKSGGAFNKDIFRKIREFKRRYPTKRIHVDGGVNGEVSFILRNMGVYASVSGSYLFKAESLGFALLNLKTYENESHFTVRDFMLNNGEIPVLPANEATFESILKTIDTYQLGFVMLSDAQGRLSGISSNADIRKGLIKHFAKLPDVPVQEMINTQPVTINESATVVELLRLIKSKNFPISYLPVVNDQGQISGALTFINLIKGEA